jgi:3-hydroxyacyl-CoA dehydrogenase
MYIFKAAVIGAGAMGAGIAQVISFSGLPVVLKDVDQKFLDKGMDTIRKIYKSRVDKGKMSAGEMDSKMSLVIPALDYSEFGDVDIIVEAVPERWRSSKILSSWTASARRHHLYQQHVGAFDQRDGRATQRPHR